MASVSVAISNGRGIPANREPAHIPQTSPRVATERMPEGLTDEELLTTRFARIPIDIVRASYLSSQFHRERNR